MPIINPNSSRSNVSRNLNNNIGELSANVSGEPMPVTGTGNVSTGNTGNIAGLVTNETTRAISTGAADRRVTNINQYPVISGKVWSSFSNGDIVPDVKQIVTEAVWSTATGSLKTFYTSSVQSASNGAFYYDIYHANPQASPSTAAVQFAISYGHRLGSGSADISSNSSVSGLTPSRTIYSQHRNILLNPADEQFELATGKSINSAIFVSFNRVRYKDKLDAGNWQIAFSGSTGAVTTLIDDYTPTSNPVYSSAGSVYNIVSGSLVNGIYNSTAPKYYGLIYPDMGTLMFDGDMLNNSCSVSMVTSSNVVANNHGRAFSAISGAAVLSTNGKDLGFQIRNEQDITSTYYFVRIKNGEYNFSNNPTFTSGSLGDLRHPEMYNDPRVYVTTVGLYDDANQLLAVAKLSKPLQKSFSREALLRIKLSY